MVGIIRNKISEYSRRVTRFTITRYWPGSVSFLRTVPREIIGESRQTGIVHLGVEPAYPVHCQFKANILACFNVAAVPWINCSICFRVQLFLGEESNSSVIAYILQRSNWYLAPGMLDVFSCACILWRTRILPGRTGTVGRAEAPILKLRKNLSAGWCSVVVASSHRIYCLWSASASKKYEGKRRWDQGSANFLISHFSSADEFMFSAGSRTKFFAIILCSRWPDPIEFSIHVLASDRPRQIWTGRRFALSVQNQHPCIFQCRLRAMN